MSSEALAFIRARHRVQKTSGSCVAACHAIADAWYGGDGIEQDDTYPALTTDFLDPAIPENFDFIAARVKRGALAIVTVSGARWMELARDRQLRSPYGDLGVTPHAVTIVAFKESFFVVLDPYFPTSSQPLQVSRDDFATAWTGQVEFVSSED